MIEVKGYASSLSEDRADEVVNILFSGATSL